ncbi:MAG TPA: hypothetical protein DHV62_07095 [Elusimicrobia bacterium]|jgi:site-specific recombinase XerD|nr:hypothetical protein [Elusimicrobiota bacterium]
MAKTEHIDIYNYKKQLERSIHLVKTSRMCEKNKNLIMKFIDYAFLEGRKPARIIKYTIVLRKIDAIIKKDFEKVNREDVEKVIRKIEKEDNSEWTKLDYKVMLKKFFRWLRKTEEYPEEVKWIKSKVNRSNHMLPEELLTEKEVKKLIEVTREPRDKAFVALLYESGCRIGEVLTLRMKHVQFDKYGAVIVVDGKTGQRRVRLVSSAPYLLEWINKHPLKDDPGAPLIINHLNKSFLTYAGITKTLKTIFKNAGIKKRCNPHIFRHSRATHLANYLTEAQMKNYFGWVQDTKMAGVYVHMSGRDVDEALLGKVYGLKEVMEEKEKQESELRPKKCPRCEEMNPPTHKFCGKCSMALDAKTAIELDEKRKESDDVITQIFKDPRIHKFLLEKLIEEGLGKKVMEIRKGRSQ